MPEPPLEGEQAPVPGQLLVGAAVHEHDGASTVGLGVLFGRGIAPRSADPAKSRPRDKGHDTHGGRENTTILEDGKPETHRRDGWKDPKQKENAPAGEFA